MNITIKRIGHLIRICVNGPGGRFGLVYCLVIILLNLAEIQIGLKMIAWNKDFFGALEKYDAHQALWQIGVFGILTACSASRYLVSNYIRQLLQIRWRTTLTTALLDAWTKNKAYWHLNTADASLLDNPDQRISEDARSFVERLVGGTSGMAATGGNVLDFMTDLAGLVTYVLLLWRLSDFSVHFSLFGYTLEITHYMIWAAPLYVLISSVMTHWLGSPLMKLNVAQKQREADMRFALTRFRESKEAIALENGEAAERKIVELRYAKILENWRRLIKRELILGCFTRPYFQTIMRIPTFLAFPAYFAGHVALGGMMQLSSSFQRVVTSLSWFIFSYKPLADLAATSNRLGQFLSEAEQAAQAPPKLSFQPSNDGHLRIRDLRVDNPQGEPLIHLADIDVGPGEVVWIDSPSGSGKSTLIKALSGIWRHCEGSIELPRGTIRFLPQSAYVPLANLAAAVTYPSAPSAPEDLARIRGLLSAVGLTHKLAPELTNEATDYKLSCGERQRLIVARILATKPDWVFMDEATSALDNEAEKQIYTLLRNTLPNTAFIIIAHREPRGLGSYRHIDLRGMEKQD